MIKNKVSAFCLMESVSEPISPTNLKTIKSDSLNNTYYLKFNSCLQSFGVRNRNRRIYESKGMAESIQAPHLQELRAKKSWCGEAGHPLTEDVKRILTIDPKLISHRVNTVEMEGNKLTGDIETLCSRYGQDMTSVILQKLESAFSLRALAQLIQQNDGTQLVRGKSHLVCYDWVILPSHMEAYQNSSKPIQIMNAALQEAGNAMGDKDQMISITESQIIDFIKDESFSVNIISDVFEVAKESMTLTKDLKHVILKEGSETYYIKIEEKIKNDITRYLSKF